jgi:hypothetical protein
MRYLILLCILLTSCITEKKRREICNECKVVQLDSIYIKDTVVKVNSDTAFIETKLDCDSLGNIRMVEINQLNGKLISMQAKLKDNTLRIISKTDTIKVYVKGNTVIKVRTDVREKLVYKDYWWKYPLLIWALIATVLYLIKKFL